MTSQLFRRARTAEHLRLAVVLVAIIASTSILVVRSEAAFTAQTENTGNQLQAGRVKLTDNAVGTAMFDVPAMVPDEVEQRCVQVVYGGTVPEEKLRSVRLHTSGPGDLGPFLVTAIEMATEGAEDFSTDADGCAGFGGTVTPLYNDALTSNAALHLQALTQAHGTYATAIDTTWTPEARDEARWFRVTFRLADDNDAQDLVANPTFTWELQSQLAN